MTRELFIAKAELDRAHQDAVTLNAPTWKTTVSNYYRLSSGPKSSTHVALGFFDIKTLRPSTFEPTWRTTASDYCRLSLGPTPRTQVARVVRATPRRQDPQRLLYHELSVVAEVPPNSWLLYLGASSRRRILNLVPSNLLNCVCVLGRSTCVKILPEIPEAAAAQNPGARLEFAQNVSDVTFEVTRS
jgi:hypothetical protein